jgi:hypothetical protein
LHVVVEILKESLARISIVFILHQVALTLRKDRAGPVGMVDDRTIPGNDANEEFIFSSEQRPSPSSKARRVVVGIHHFMSKIVIQNIGHTAKVPTARTDGMLVLGHLRMMFRGMGKLVVPLSFGSEAWKTQINFNKSKEIKLVFLHAMMDLSGFVMCRIHREATNVTERSIRE